MTSISSDNHQRACSACNSFAVIGCYKGGMSWSFTETHHNGETHSLIYPNYTSANTHLAHFGKKHDKCEDAGRMHM